MDGLSYANQTFNLSLPAVETPAHGLTAATSTTTGTGTDNNCSAGLRRSQRPTAGRRRQAPPSPSRAAQPSTSSATTTPVDTTTAAAADATPASGAQPSASSSPAHVMKSPKKYHHPVAAAAAAAASCPCAPAPAPAAPAAAPLILPNLVKMEVSSDCEGDGSLSGGGACAAAVVDGGYSSSSTLDDTPYTSEEEEQQQQVDSVEFDKDDNAACDSLLRDILGQQDGSADDDEFLSLLSEGDMMIVNPASEGLSEGFVKREPNNTSIVF